MILAVCPNPSVDAFWAFPELHAGEANRSASESWFPGGKGVHTALALQELGETVRLAGIWGGPTGRWIRQQCAGQEVETVGPETGGWTRICITNRSDGVWDQTELRGAGPEISAETGRDFRKACRRELEEHSPKAVVAGGSLPSGMPTTIYRDLARMAAERGIPFYLDAEGDPLRAALEARPRAVHLNRREARGLTGEDDPARMARKLAEHCRLAAVTDGKRGLYLCSGETVLHAVHDLDSGDIAGTVGAGDCLLAGLCNADVQGMDLPELARRAVACGSANCVNPELGMLDASDVELFQKQVRVETLSGHD